LYNRTTDDITLTHLEIASLKAILREHADLAPERMLFLWTLFEGVPKFYRDFYEQGVLNQDRRTLLRRIFFESSSPLRAEAENWFLKELRGQYDVVLKFVARHAGCLHNELAGQIAQVQSPDTMHPRCAAAQPRLQCLQSACRPCSSWLAGAGLAIYS
jgi:hypothetical protein